MNTNEHEAFGFVLEQVPVRRRISNKSTLTLTLSRPTREGTGRPVSRGFESAWIRRLTEDDSPSPLRWEGAGVRVSLPQNPKLFLRGSLTRFATRPGPCCCEWGLLPSFVSIRVHSWFATTYRWSNAHKG